MRTQLRGGCRGDQVEQAIKAFGSSWASLFADPLVSKSVRRFMRLVRPDSTGAPTAFPPGSAFVSDSSHRGATGAHYTPRSLTEEVVRRTLEPLVYLGPVDGQPQEEWVLRNSEEIVGLRICDPACGSGAFLVQSCRYLAKVLSPREECTGQRPGGPITADEVARAPPTCGRVVFAWGRRQSDGVRNGEAIALDSDDGGGPSVLIP